MTTAAIGALIGLLAGAGLLVAVLCSPPLRRQTLSDRVAPYLRDAPTPSRLLTAPRMPGGTALGRLTAPVVADLVRFLDRIVGGQASVRNRLATLGSPITVEQFRAEQVEWGALGALAGIGVAVLAVASGHGNPIVLAALILTCSIAGVLARDWWLSRAVAEREAEILTEFPVIAEMLALAVTAGEGPLGAIDRITRLAHGPLVDQLSAVLADTRSGTALLEALAAARDRTRLEPLARFLDGMAVAIERGTPLADVLRAQAADVRDMGKRQLLQAGGKKEILMMVPVVFIILPVTILFALFPGLIAITTVAQ
jgi:tight adherence protein C